MRRTILAVMLVLLSSRYLATQTTSETYMLDWLPAESHQGFLERVHARLSRLADAVMRYTSPDITRESRRLWKMSLDGKGKCLVSLDTGVHSPKWGKGGQILYLVEADTNHDGRIDALDDYVVRIVPEGGGKSIVEGIGKSAVWSPDGRFVAIARGGQVTFADLDGNPVPASSTPGGRIVTTNSPNPEVARSFLELDVQTKTTAPMPEDLRSKYLWLGTLSPSAGHVIFSCATRKELIVIDAGNSERRSISGDGALVLDPAWSPDEKEITFVSTAAGQNLCPGK